MFGLSWFEMLIVGVAALIFIGPKDLPVVMRQLGKVTGQIRRMGADFQREINKSTGLDEVRNLRNSITAPLKKTTDEIRREFNAMTPTGVQPTGVIKPADPKVESVADEIRAAAGMPPAAKPVASAAAAAANPAAPAEPVVAAKPAAKKAPVKAKAAPTRPVITTDLTPLESTAPAIVEPALPPAVIDTAAPKKRVARKTAATAQPSAEGAAQPVAKKPAPRKPAAKRAPKAAPTSAGNE